MLAKLPKNGMLAILPMADVLYPLTSLGVLNRERRKWAHNLVIIISPC